MKKIHVLPALLLLSACGGATADVTLKERLENPLYAEMYYDSMVDHMTNLVIQQDPLAGNESVKDVIEDRRSSGLRKAGEAVAKQNMGKTGTIVSDFELARGEVLLLDNVVYTSPDFNVVAGPDVHVYLTTLADAKDVRFPDDSAIYVGPLASVYGAHSYALPEGTDTSDVRMLAIYDKSFKRMYGFAQLRSAN
jgi:hypothetical protein